MPDAPKDTAASEGPPETPRRRFLIRMAAALGGLGVAAATLVPFGAFLFSPLIRRQKTDAWRRLGSVDDFAVGRTTRVTFVDPEPLPWAGFAGESAAWLRREEGDRFVAFSVYCTHVGCPVRWMEGAQLFMCPCHGGTFHRDGSVAAGPPPSPLPRHEVRILNGQVEIRTRPIAAELRRA